MMRCSAKPHPRRRLMRNSIPPQPSCCSGNGREAGQQRCATSGAARRRYSERLSADRMDDLESMVEDLTAMDIQQQEALP